LLIATALVLTQRKKTENKGKLEETQEEVCVGEEETLAG